MEPTKSEKYAFTRATSQAAKNICEKLGFCCEIDGEDVEYNGTMTTLALFLADYSREITPADMLVIFDAGQDVARVLFGKKASFNPNTLKITFAHGTVSIWHMLACFDSPKYMEVALDFAKYKAEGGAYRIEYFYHILQKTN